MWPAARSIVSVRPSKRSGARASTSSIDGSPRRALDLLDCQPHVRTWLGCERGGRSAFVARGGGTSFAHPPGPAAVEHGDGVVTEIAQRPPEPAGVHPGVLVVGDDLRVARDSQPAEHLGQRFDRWHRMAAVGPCSRPREVLTEAGIHGARECERPDTDRVPTTRSGDRSGNRRSPSRRQDATRERRWKSACGRTRSGWWFVVGGCSALTANHQRPAAHR